MLAPVFNCTVLLLQVGSNTPNFNRMAGNPLAKQIPWDTNPTLLAAWKEGNTGELAAGRPTYLGLQVLSAAASPLSQAVAWHLCNCTQSCAPACAVTSS